MRIVWIGAGNLPTQMSGAMHEAGHEICQVFSRTLDSAEKLASRFGCSATNDLNKVVCDAEVYIFSVTDRALEDLVSCLAPRLGNALCLHTAGSMPMSLFQGKAVRYGVLYPMQTFSRARSVSFREVPCFIESSSAEVGDCLEQLACSISEKVVWMDSERRRTLHLAAVFACNFANHCYALAEEVLQRQGIPFEVMLPLIDETARKVHGMSPRKAQTGPAVRYDTNVLERQKEMLSDMPELQLLYEEMSRSIHRLATEEKQKEQDT